MRTLILRTGTFDVQRPWQTDPTLWHRPCSFIGMATHLDRPERPPTFEDGQGIRDRAFEFACRVVNGNPVGGSFFAFLLGKMREVDFAGAADLIYGPAVTIRCVELARSIECQFGGRERPSLLKCTWAMAWRGGTGG